MAEIRTGNHAARVFTAEQKLMAVRREVRLRRGVYASRVAAGRMSVSDSEREISVMEAIAADYQRIVDDERAKKDLFGGA